MMAQSDKSNPKFFPIRESKILTEGLKYYEHDGHDMPKRVARDALKALGVKRMIHHEYDEAAVLLDWTENIFWHIPQGRTGGSLPEPSTLECYNGKSCPHFGTSA